MKIYVNKKGEIKDVHSTTNTTLQEIEIPDDNNPFEGWSDVRICCFRAEMKNGNLDYAPYIDTRIIDYMDRLSQQNISAQAQIDYIAMMTDIEM
ncbi:MAG: hypothetical protein E7284_10185 [Lachnospiraceae bacterium]|nr:hypothetical protein [Lachnospiraceae bacterium]